MNRAEQKSKEIKCYCYRQQENFNGRENVSSWL